MKIAYEFPLLTSQQHGLPEPVSPKTLLNVLANDGTLSHDARVAAAEALKKIQARPPVPASFGGELIDINWPMFEDGEVR